MPISSKIADQPRCQTVLLDVQGMHCAGCASHVEQALAGIAGVCRVQVNLLTNQASVEFDPDKAGLDALTAAVRKAGYSASPVDDALNPGDTLRQQQAVETAAWQRRLIAGAVMLAPLLWLTHFAAISAAPAFWSRVLLATAMQFYLGWPYLAGAWQRLRHASANMDTLVALGTTTAYVAGLAGHSMYFADAGMILTFITLGKFLETKTKGRASEAIRKLFDMAPREATVLRGERTLRVPIAAVAIGETIIVAPGEKVPLDAHIIAGASSVDEAWLTGESIPADKQSGDEILAGTINLQGSLTARVLRPAGKTALAQVIAMVHRAQESKTTAGRVADRVVAWFVPAVLVIALVTLAAWGLAAENWPQALASTVAVLVVACPCALGLATPTAILVGSGRGAELGIFIKEPRALEQAGRLTTVLLDKTGTITLGQPEVTAVLPVEGVSAAQLLATAAAAERLSRHPLSQAIVAAAAGRKGTVPFSLTRKLGQSPETRADSLETIPGSGVRAQSETGLILVGNQRLMEASDVDCTALLATMDSLRAAGQTPLLVAAGRRLLGIIALADAVAPHSAEAVQQLKSLGVEVCLLSGDHSTTAHAVAGQVGIVQVIAEVLPGDKQAVVRRLQAAGQVVAMVGDGINDAPALAAADLGIAIGSGADVAIETADIVLIRRDLRAVPEAIALSRATLRTIRQNLAWAFIYNMMLVPVAAGILAPWGGFCLPPAAAAAAMAVSSVSVVANSLLLKRRKLV